MKIIEFMGWRGFPEGWVPREMNPECTAEVDAVRPRKGQALPKCDHTVDHHDAPGRLPEGTGLGCTRLPHEDPVHVLGTEYNVWGGPRRNAIFLRWVDDGT